MGIESDVADNWPETLLHVFSFLQNHQFLTPIVFHDYYEPNSIDLPDDCVVVLDAVNPTNNITHNWNENIRRGYLNRICKARRKIQEAIDFEKQGRYPDAIENWCQIFGERFRDVR
jgi:hypothetical protein